LSEFLHYYLKTIGVNTPVEIENRPHAVSTTAGLDHLSQQVSNCRACDLAEGRNQVVFGVGNPHADILFIGEAPGKEEDLKGEPFVGRAGKLLDHMLDAVGLDRSGIYIMNMLKCRPPKNRDPRPQEVQACAKWFDAQWNEISPKVVCLLGRIAAQNILATEAPLASLRGRWHEHRGVPVWVTYHPAYLLRSPGQKRRVWEDLQILMRRYRSLS